MEPELVDSGLGMDEIHCEKKEEKKRVDPTLLSSCQKDQDHYHSNIPKLFFNLYFGSGASVYTLLTFWLFFECFFGQELFATSGFFYMLAITGLMWISVILTFLASQLSAELIGIKNFQLRPAFLFTLTLLLKLLTDAAIFYGSIEALRDQNLTHYHEFSQFVFPLMYFGLLYLVTVIEIIVIVTTIAVMEDRCKLYATILRIEKVKKNVQTYLRSKFPPAAEDV